METNKQKQNKTNKQKNILGDPRDVRKVKPGITLILWWSSKTETLFVSSVTSILPLTQAVPMPTRRCHGGSGLISKNRSSWRRGKSPWSPAIWFQSDQLCVLRSPCLLSATCLLRALHPSKTMATGSSLVPLLFLGKERESASYLNTESPAPSCFAVSRHSIVRKLECNYASLLHKIFLWPPPWLQDKLINIFPAFFPSCALFLIV